MSEEEKYKELYNKALSDLVKADKRNIEKKQNNRSNGRLHSNGRHRRRYMPKYKKR